ncbi:MAG: DNA topoisomerase IV subunit A [Acidobacteria bacterium]|nr:DNA topoisomerase IV subunit A [Acidobacteriota bacterium]
MNGGQKKLPLDLEARPENPQPAPPASAAGRAADRLQATGEGPLKKLVDRNFLQYASYVIRDRAIPDLEDGLKPVQRRILFSLHENDDGKFIKVANIVGFCMQFHPHGDASIEEALVVLANKRFLIERQGNFGNLLTGDPPAAARYIECRLTPMAREEIFNDDLTDFTPTYDGRRREPVLLPAKIPLLLMLGAEGIAVGISTRILPHNFSELLEAQIAILEKRPFKILPDFPQGGLMDAENYDDGRGHVLVRARIEKKGDGALVIRELPFGATTDSVTASIEDAARRGKLNIRSIHDFTAENVEIEIRLAADQKQERAIAALYAFTQCQVQIPSRIVVIRDNKPVDMDVPAILRHNTRRLVKILERELERRKRNLLDAAHNKTLAQLFIENRVYKKIETLRSADEIQKAVLEGLEPFRGRLRQDITRNDIEALLNLPIRRISLFDLDRNRQEIRSLGKELEEVRRDLEAMVPYAIRYLRGLLRKYRSQSPRQTKLKTFGRISERELTKNELTINHDREKGYIGHKVDGTRLAVCSPLDRILLVWNDGRCRVVSPPEKLFVDASLLYCAVLDRERVMTAVYELDFFTYFKKFVPGGLVKNRDSRFAPKGSRVLFFSGDDPPSLYVRYAEDERIKIRQQKFSIALEPVRGRDAKGQVLTANRIEYVGSARARDWNDELDGPPGKFIDSA